MGEVAAKLTALGNDRRLGYSSGYLAVPEVPAYLHTAVMVHEMEKEYAEPAGIYHRSL